MNSSYPRKLPKFDYLEAKTVEEACSLLSKYEGKAKVIAGGTDLIVSMKYRQIIPQYIINIKTIPNLAYIRYANGEGLRIGALTTLEDIESSSIIRERFPEITSAAHQIGQPQIRNVGTIGGNLCNAAPSADTAPPLIGLGARVKIRGVQEERVIALEDFFLGPGQTALRAGEILAEILVPSPPPYTRGVYLKLPARTAIDIAVVGVAVVVTQHTKNAGMTDIKIVLGAVAPTPMRAREAEGVIREKAVTEELMEKAAQAAAEEAKPISDIRGSASYRRQMVKVLTKQALKEVVSAA